MNICVAGWYYNPSFIRAMEDIDDHDNQVTVIGHRSGDTGTLHKYTIVNIGLEFGCYDHYLKNIWRGGDTLFIHDDTEIEDIQSFMSKVKGLATYFSQCFIYSSGKEYEGNDGGNGGHGRAFFCSNRFCRILLRNGGFWYDDNNHGDVTDDPTARGVHQKAIIAFVAQLKNFRRGYGLATGMGVIIPELKNGRRGVISE